MTKSQDTQKLTAEEQEAVDLFRRLPKAETDEILIKTFEMAALDYAVKVLQCAKKELMKNKTP